MQLSIIIPTYNEAATIGQLLQYLRQHVTPDTELLIADGGSKDGTQSIAEANGVSVVACASKGRALQMNTGAAAASGNILYFLHADTYPPKDFQEQIQRAVQHGYGSGCFRLRFDLVHWFLRANAWFTRFDVDAVRFGDQSLFVEREVFWKAGGYNEKFLLLEDQEIVKRLKRYASFTVLPSAVVTSARKYKHYGVLRLQSVYYLVYTAYRLGLTQTQLVKLYKKLLP
ncbi:TIGR04283 family arsenosugar biosynthesis glycosyltransferase [Pontibacter harenae]|uniref:TIGR04283 family arsenosugar biosynthesis glycosyltransferase n=1 Tax=Pontibacter harenae TaxID=2894083 RepID=UPI001E5DF012|nr:TIGR04283 family arsenosugar biosynthesis glycosyltransferase [Pontibacter harenae]MCC9167669.1 TIGR04283 family arsenosugar biosynthesis glycosyltransferase [Pontibacter harenae]